jgi:hypothetical protein
MPAVSKVQARFMAMCLHDPQKAKKKCPSKKVAQEFARTSHRGLPERVKRRK